jgi:hypothetical protein
MVQCEQCEFCSPGPDGRKVFTCDPFSNVKEPECVAKWQLMRLEMLLTTYQDMVRWYGRLAPLQDKIFKFVQREITDMDESDHWKADHEDPDPPEDPDNADDWPV